MPAERVAAAGDSRWTTRIVDHGEASPSELVGNPRNWRLHPRHQSDALTAALDRVGWVQPVIVNRRSGHLIDGHLRVALALNRDEPVVPVDYVDLSEEEERVVLATLDPLAALAGTDEGALKGLLATLEGELDAALAKVMDDLTRADGSAASALPSQEEIDQRAAELEARFQGRPHNMAVLICPECGHEFQVNVAELTGKG
jgi:ParB-like chromosome segregation protein Spo0J